jgi:hypothetical protein
MLQFINNCHRHIGIVRHLCFCYSEYWHSHWSWQECRLSTYPEPPGLCSVRSTGSLLQSCWLISTGQTVLRQAHRSVFFRLTSKMKGLNSDVNKNVPWNIIQSFIYYSGIV